MKQTELAWAAGFFDGEGCFCTTRRNDNGKYRFRLFISQKDPAVLRKFARIFGIRGHVYGPDRKGIYALQVADPGLVCRVGRLLWPHLGTVKRRQYTTKLKEYRNGNKAASWL